MRQYRIYVDDATMVLWAKQAMAGSAETPALNRMAYEVASEWTHGREFAHATNL